MLCPLRRACPSRHPAYQVEGNVHAGSTNSCTRWRTQSFDASPSSTSSLFHAPACYVATTVSSLRVLHGVALVYVLRRPRLRPRPRTSLNSSSSSSLVRACSAAILPRFHPATIGTSSPITPAEERQNGKFHELPRAWRGAPDEDARWKQTHEGIHPGGCTRGCTGGRTGGCILRGWVNAREYKEGYTEVGVGERRGVGGKGTEARGARGGGV